MKEYPVFYTTLNNGETLAYRKCGRSPRTLVLIHGNMSSSVHWQTTMEKLEDFFTIFALDLRGFGDSSYTNPVDSLGELSVDVSLFLSKMDLDEVYLLGWSAGGGVALEASVDSTSRIRRTLLLNSVGLSGYRIESRSEAINRWIMPSIRGAYAVRKTVDRDPTVRMMERLIQYGDRNMIRYILNNTLYKYKRPPGEELERYIDAVLKQRNIDDIYYCLLNFNMSRESNGVAEGSGRIDLIEKPVSLLVSDHDSVVPPREAEATRELLGDRVDEIKLFKDSGHSPMTDHLEEFTTYLRDNLR